MEGLVQSERQMLSIAYIKQRVIEYDMEINARQGLIGKHPFIAETSLIEEKIMK